MQKQTAWQKQFDLIRLQGSVIKTDVIMGRVVSVSFPENEYGSSDMTYRLMLDCSEFKDQDFFNQVGWYYDSAHQNETYDNFAKGVGMPENFKYMETLEARLPEKVTDYSSFGIKVLTEYDNEFSKEFRESDCMSVWEFMSKKFGNENKLKI